MVGGAANPHGVRRAIALALVLTLAAASAQASPGSGFQAACDRLVGDQAATVVAFDPASHQLRALVHPALAREPHPPGSVFKLVTALAAVATGQAPPRAVFCCDGAYRPPDWSGKPLLCWKPGGHGRLLLEEAIAQSCNCTFYQLSTRVGFAALDETARRCGMGVTPGWLRRPRDPAAQALLGIGEGAGIGVTAVQLAGLVGAIATGGPPVAPAWAPRPATGPPVADVGTLKRLRAAMRAAVVHGSARGAGVPGLAVAGKTGTATYTDGSNRTYGWFVGYAPSDAPRLAVVVLVKEATGFHGATGLARRVLLAWLAAGRP